MAELLQPLQQVGLSMVEYAKDCCILVSTLSSNFVSESRTGEGTSYLEMGWRDEEGNITYTITEDNRKVPNNKYRTAL